MKVSDLLHAQAALPSGKDDLIISHWAEDCLLVFCTQHGKNYFEQTRAYNAGISRKLQKYEI
jgi:hypothetical protein